MLSVEENTKVCTKNQGSAMQRFCIIFDQKNVFSKSMLARQGCALANLRLEFLRMIFLNLRRAVGTRISLILKGGFFGAESEVRSAVLRWSQRHFTSFWLWDHRNIAFSGARKSLGARDSCTQINRLIY